MENGKKNSTMIVGIIVLIIAVAAVVIMAIMMKNVISEKELAEQEVSELKADKEILENGISDLQTKIEDLANENNENNDKREINDVTEKQQLTRDELVEIENFLNNHEVNGFISYNIYNKVSEIDLNGVFYNYGSEEEKNRQEISDYLYTLGQNELMTDLGKVTTTKAQEIYKKYTGYDITKDELKNRITNWTYLEKYDAFYHQHGDTNYNIVACKSGYKSSDGKYYITLNYQDDMYEDQKKYDSTNLTLKKKGNVYLFISNVVND